MRRLLAVLVALLVATPVAADTYQTPDADYQDSRLDQGNPSTNYGASAFLTLGGDGSNRNSTVYQWSGLDIVGELGCSSCVIQSATLFLRVSYWSVGPEVQAHRLTTSWAEGTVTWATPWTTGGGDYVTGTDPAHTFTGPSGTWNEVDVTSIVQDWADGEAQLGILVRATSAAWTSMTVHTFEAPGSRPYLVVEYAEGASALVPVFGRAGAHGLGNTFGGGGGFGQ